MDGQIRQHRRSRARHWALIFATGAAFAAAAADARADVDAASRELRVVVTAHDAADASAALARVHGRDVQRVDIVDGAVATIAERDLRELRHAPGVTAVVVDRSFQLHQAPVQTDEGISLTSVGEAMSVPPVAGGRGAGVDVAIIDSGVTPVPGLDGEGKLVYGPDLSEDARNPELQHLDVFGHGTHLAGIIAAGGAGVADASRIVSVKVADHEGETSLSRLLVAIDWVVRNKRRGGLNVRVLSLAFGAEPLGPYTSDPLAVAVEQAWREGIVVMAAAGNGGAATEVLDSPAFDPYVVAVGANDTLGTAQRDDDIVADFSSRGSAGRPVDVLAPGVGVVSLRVPGSHLDELFPNARIGDGGFRGSGTSQSAAAAAGAVAVLLGLRPALTPDQVKAVLRASADPIAGAEVRLQGAGELDLAGALARPVPAAWAQRWTPARGGGAWRIRAAVGVQLAVEHQNAGRWSASRWSASRWSASRWSASRWSASRWSASRWSASRWSASRWSASRWSTAEWGAGLQ